MKYRVVIHEMARQDIRRNGGVALAGRMSGEGGVCVPLALPVLH